MPAVCGGRHQQIRPPAQRGNACRYLTSRALIAPNYHDDVVKRQNGDDDSHGAVVSSMR